MNQILNGFDEKYYLTEDGRVFDNKLERFVYRDKKYCYILTSAEGTRKKVALKTLYRLVFDKEFCFDNIEDLPEEEWREVERTNGTYLCSSLGRIKSLKGYKSIILKPNKIKRYYRVDIVQDNQRYSKFVHRIVASAFLDKPESIDMQIHHKDGNSLNNRADNLEWLTPSEHKLKHQEVIADENISESKDNPEDTQTTL